MRPAAAAGRSRCPDVRLRRGPRRIVAEPDARNDDVLQRLERTGFVLGPEVELPEVDLPEVYLPAKRARLAFLSAPGSR
ncbi:hypothetical protein AB0F11_15270 [Streptomyces sp. NPDC032472]|uniref:hypothetical protein n=1 Tax=Streptomyces sp. NPDC032472 TaxID=3155018 RepID=UPI0033E95C1B